VNRRRSGLSRATRGAIAALALASLIGLTGGLARAQAQTRTPAPAERVAFADAIQRAIEKNPSTAVAAAGILRAEGLLTEARANARLQINGTLTETTLNRGVEFQGATVTPQNQVTGALDVRLPLYAPARWARRAQAGDTKSVAELTAADARRQIALATADAYLTIIARRRVVEADERARQTAKAHYDLAHELQLGGTGSRLNELRAQQEVSTDEGLVESARLALYRAQEALGVLLVADGPIDAGDEPAFALPPDAELSSPSGGIAAAPILLQFRADLKLFATEQQAAERVLRDSAKDYWPYLEGIVQPQTTQPAQFFVPSNSTRFLLQMTVPLFDSGQRRGVKGEREAALHVAKATADAAMTQATSEVRAAREAVGSAARGLVSAVAAANEAQQVVNIVNVSFRAGAATNIEVIDAERSARDADTAVAVAEDTLRRARLELIAAVGRFP
jgi:outer membrane protein TolC